MKNFNIFLLLLFWMMFTVILSCTIIGLIVVLRRDDYSCKHFQGEEGMSPWMRFGRTLQRNFLK